MAVKLEQEWAFLYLHKFLGRTTGDEDTPAKQDPTFFCLSTSLLYPGSGIDGRTTWFQASSGELGIN